jgi:hypothetical protein
MEQVGHVVEAAVSRDKTIKGHPAMKAVVDLVVKLKDHVESSTTDALVFQSQKKSWAVRFQILGVAFTMMREDVLCAVSCPQCTSYKL